MRIGRSRRADGRRAPEAGGCRALFREGGRRQLGHLRRESLAIGRQSSVVAPRLARKRQGRPRGPAAARWPLRPAGRRKNRRATPCAAGLRPPKGCSLCRWLLLGFGPQAGSDAPIPPETWGVLAGGCSGERSNPSDGPHVRRAFARRRGLTTPRAKPGGLRSAGGKSRRTSLPNSPANGLPGQAAGFAKASGPARRRVADHGHAAPASRPIHDFKQHVASHGPPCKQPPGSLIGACPTADTGEPPRTGWEHFPQASTDFRRCRIGAIGRADTMPLRQEDRAARRPTPSPSPLRLRLSGGGEEKRAKQPPASGRVRSLTLRPHPPTSNRMPWARGRSRE